MIRYKYMVLYHGTSDRFETPGLFGYKTYRDFGTGFYTYTQSDEAYKMARMMQRRNNTSSSYINQYKIELNGLRVIELDTITPRWLYMIHNSRDMGKFQESCDIVIGKAINSKVDRAILDLESRYGLISEIPYSQYKELADKLSNIKLKTQVCLSSIKARKALEFIGTREISGIRYKTPKLTDEIKHIIDIQSDKLADYYTTEYGRDLDYWRAVISSSNFYDQLMDLNTRLYLEGRAYMNHILSEELQEYFYV